MNCGTIQFLGQSCRSREDRGGVQTERLILARFREGSVGQKQSRHGKYSLAELAGFVVVFK